MKLLSTAVLLLVSRLAAADVCALTINATDQMRFEQQTLQVESQCAEVEVTLRNTGKLPANIMGHDWVLTKTSDVASVANAGMGAGLANNYQKPGDKRIVAIGRCKKSGADSGSREKELRTPQDWRVYCTPSPRRIHDPSALLHAAGR